MDETTKQELFDPSRHTKSRAELKRYLEELTQHEAGQVSPGADGAYTRDQLVGALRTMASAVEQILAMTVSVATDRLVFDRFGLDIEKFLAKPPSQQREAVEDALLGAKSLNAGRWPEYANYPMDMWLAQNARGGLDDGLAFTCLALHLPDVEAERPESIRTVLDLLVSMHWGRRQPSVRFTPPPSATDSKEAA